MRHEAESFLISHNNREIENRNLVTSSGHIRKRPCKCSRGQRYPLCVEVEFPLEASFSDSSTGFLPGYILGTTTATESFPQQARFRAGQNPVRRKQG